METQIVRSYVRNKHQRIESEEVDNKMGMVLGASAVILLALAYASITLPIVASVGAAYGVKTLIIDNLPSKQVESVTEAVEQPKPKRTYNKRITVNHYQHKSVRV